MALETERTDRDYLYGRLLAVAEHIEETALRIAKEPRGNNCNKAYAMTIVIYQINISKNDERTRSKN